MLQLRNCIDVYKRQGESASGKPRRRRHRGGRGSNAEAAAEKTATQNGDEKAETPVDQVLSLIHI